MMKQIEYSMRRLISQPIVISFASCAIAWWLTAAASHIFWKNPLPDLSLTSNLLGFLLPMVVVMFFSFKICNQRWQSIMLQAVFAGIFLFTCANVLFENILPLRVYGDCGQVGNLAANGNTYSRWLVGSGIITFIFQKVIHPLFANLDSLTFIKIFGSLVMCIASALLIRKYPQRLSIIFPVLTPVWLLFALGYDEYYPFITPLFLLFLVTISEDFLSKIHPLVLGFFAALLGLLYAGFIPLSLYLLFVYFLRRGLKFGFFALGAAVVSALFLIWIFWPASMQKFLPDYYSKLNIKDSSLFPGMSSAHTPFFKIKYALSEGNIRRMLYSQFWAGGILAPMILLGVLAFKRFYSQAKRKTLAMISIGLFFLWQIFYFIFMIPRLGVVQDIDLFFSVYLTIAFFGGVAADLLTRDLLEITRAKIRIGLFSAFLGSSAYASLYLILLGLPPFLA